MPMAETTSEAVGANLHCREGNNPDRQLRSLSTSLVGKEVGLHRQPGCWLRSSTIARVRNSSLVEWSCADNVTGLKLVTEAADCC